MNAPVLGHDTQALSKIDQADLMRAVRHHRRALAALEGVTFSGIDGGTSRALRIRLRQDLDDLQAELERRERGGLAVFES